MQSQIYEYFNILANLQLNIMNLQEAVAKRLSNLLHEKKLTQYSLCQKIGMNQTTIYNITHARCKSVTLKTIYYLADGLGITLQEFINDPLFNQDNLEVE